MKAAITGCTLEGLLKEIIVQSLNHTSCCEYLSRPDFFKSEVIQVVMDFIRLHNLLQAQ